jgi:hypothetical protein
MASQTGEFPASLALDTFIVSLVPWEKVRDRRLADYATRLALDDSQFAHMEIEHNRAGDAMNQLLEKKRTNPRLSDQWSDTTLFRNFYDEGRVRWESISYCDLENMRRALLWQVAIRIWQLEHDGNLPDRLEDLPNVESLPRDVYTDNLFAYCAKGFAGYFAEYPTDTSAENEGGHLTDVRLGIVEPQGMLIVKVPKGYPVLWSAGAYVQLVSDGVKTPLCYRIRYPTNRMASTTTADRVVDFIEPIWDTGHTYPLYEEP